MPARKRSRLTDAAIARLRPRAREYAVWDSRVPGLGLRVRPTGAMTWVILEEADGRTRRVSLGSVSTMTVNEARRECHERRANPKTKKPARPERSVPTFREFVDGDWKAAHLEHCKPATWKTYSWLLGARILPAFGTTPLDRITSSDVGRRFDAWSRIAPGNANNALKLLRQILNFAVARGHLDRNPARDITLNPRPRMTRFLSREEVARLHRILDEQSGPGSGREQAGDGRAQADIIRLLLLTGCRRNEIVGLRWSEVRDDTLVLADSKVGPRKVPLSDRARAILDGRPKGESPFVFPSPREPSRPRGPNLALWYRVRREAGIEDVRLHDLRHTHASHAVINGVPVPVVSRLLGHSSTRMTLRYAHLGDRDIEAAAERIGQAIADIMGAGVEHYGATISQ